MKPSALEIRRVAANEQTAEKLANIEAKLDAILRLLENSTPGAVPHVSPAPTTQETKPQRPAAPKTN